jgi:glycosylphosphatidylinositol transamidase
MALLEILQRRLAKANAARRIITLLPRISIILTLLSVLFMLTLPMSGQYRHVYISENALMPGQAHPYFRESEWNFVRGYKNEVVNLMNSPLSERNQFVQELLSDMGYKTNVLPYTDPETGEEKPILYAIYHAPKGDDTEAMVLTAPWYNDEGKLNVGALSMSLGLAKYFKRLSIWAKNIILVFPEDGGHTLRYWVDAYHTSLDNTGGSIEAAIVIDCPISGDYIGHIEIDYSGVNGQLPNLDFVNTVVHVADAEGVKTSINGTPFGQLWTNDYPSRVNALINGIFEIAGAGVVRAVDAQSFSGWNIQAVTLRAKEGRISDITAFGRVIESTFRSVNNLLEKFHQSFFFYLLLGSKVFVSIGMYLPASAMSSLAFVLASINSWFGGSDITNLNNISANSNFDFSMLKKRLSFRTTSLVGAVITVIITISGFVYYGLYTSGIIYTEDKFDYNLFTYKYFVIPLLVSAVLPLPASVLLKVLRVKIHADYSRALSTIVLFYMGYILFGMMILNFSLSFVVSICSAPMFCIRYSSNSQLNAKNQLRNTLLLVSSCPALWLTVFGLIHKFQFDLDVVRNLFQYFEFSLLQKEIQRVLDFFEDTPIETLIDGPVELFKGLALAYKNVQCWTWMFLNFSWLPVWLCMAIVASIPVYNVETEETKKDN